MADWRERSACRDVDPELFFPIGKGTAYVAETERAKAVCRWCPVRDECLDFALDTKAIGIFGGMDEDDRRKLRRRQRASAR